MFRRLAAPICFALFSAVACMGAASPAQAGQYGSFVISNPSSVAIMYYVKWGDERIAYTVEPYHEIAHYMELDANGMAPIPYVTFDNYGGDGRETLVTYEVDFYEVDNPSNGKDYELLYAADGRHIDLYEG